MQRNSLYLYGIIDDPEIRARLPCGLGGEKPEILAIAGLGAIVSAIEGESFDAGAANICRCLTVLEALMGLCTVLPARFGSVYAGRQELEDYIANSLDILHADMERVRGHIEIGVRITGGGFLVAFEEPPTADDGVSHAAGFGPTTLGPGASYLARKQDEAARRASQKRAIEELAHTVIAPLSPLVSSHTWRVTPSPTGEPGLSLAFLLRPERLNDLRGALEEQRRAEPRLELLCTGPWPPYSFVGDVQAFAEGEQDVHTGSL
jgi:hypothetical protein